jgi:hypothetical protein
MSFGPLLQCYGLLLGPCVADHLDLWHAEATELALYQTFAPFGALLSCSVPCDPGTGRCR